MEVVKIDANPLSDDELNEIAELLSDSPAISNVSVASFGSFDPGVDDEDEPLTLNIYFVPAHWKKITGNSSKEKAAEVASKWIVEQLNARRTKQSDKYETIVRATSDIFSLVKV